MFVYHIFMTSLLWFLLVIGLYKGIIYKFLNACPLDYIAVVDSGKVERS